MTNEDEWSCMIVVAHSIRNLHVPAPSFMFLHAHSEPKQKLTKNIYCIKNKRIKKEDIQDDSRWFKYMQSQTSPAFRQIPRQGSKFCQILFAKRTDGWPTSPSSRQACLLCMLAEAPTNNEQGGPPKIRPPGTSLVIFFLAGRRAYMEHDRDRHDGQGTGKPSFMSIQSLTIINIH